MHALISRWGSVDLMVLAPLCKVLNEDNGTSSKEEKMKSSSSLEKRVHQRKWIVHPIKLGRKKKIHQGDIGFWESIKMWEKEKAIKLENISIKEKEREVNARIFIKLRENIDS